MGPQAFLRKTRRNNWPVISAKSDCALMVIGSSVKLTTEARGVWTKEVAVEAQRGVSGLMAIAVKNEREKRELTFFLPITEEGPLEVKFDRRWDPKNGIKAKIVPFGEKWVIVAAIGGDSDIIAASDPVVSEATHIVSANDLCRFLCGEISRDELAERSSEAGPKDEAGELAALRRANAGLQTGLLAMTAERDAALQNAEELHIRVIGLDQQLETLLQKAAEEAKAMPQTHTARLETENAELRQALEAARLQHTQELNAKDLSPENASAEAKKMRQVLADIQAAVDGPMLGRTKKIREALATLSVP